MNADVVKGKKLFCKSRYILPVVSQETLATLTVSISLLVDKQ